MLDLSAPKVITFIASVVLALVAVVIHYAHIKVPITHYGLLHFVGGLCSACCGQRVSRRLVPLAPRQSMAGESGGAWEVDGPSK